MTLTDAILATFVATLILAVAIYFIVRGVRAVWKMANASLNAQKTLTAVAREAVQGLRSVQAELAYMRQMTQAVVQNSEQPSPAPPVGRAGTMPPAYPNWNDFHPNLPDAAPEDTDRRVLEQTEEDMLVAQGHEEMRARGVEPDIDDAPQPAVREDV